MEYLNETDSYINRILGLRFEDRGELKMESGGAIFQSRLCAIEGVEYALLGARNPGGKLARLIRDFKAAEQETRLPCILVTDTMDNTLRRQFILHRVSFVVPGRQIFIPELGTYFTENRLNAYREVERLSPAAQLLLLRHLLRRNYDGTSLGEIAKDLGYSAKTVTLVGMELKRAGLCKVTPSGRKSKFLTFPAEGRALWDMALPMLESPVRSVGYVPLPDIDTQIMPMTSDQALAHHCGAPWDGQPRYAVKKKSPKGDELAEKASEEKFEDSVMVEFWKYDPCKLASGGYVDPLSLALSLRGESGSRLSSPLDSLVDVAFH